MKTQTEIAIEKEQQRETARSIHRQVSTLQRNTEAEGKWLQKTYSDAQIEQRDTAQPVIGQSYCEPKTYIFWHADGTKEKGYTYDLFRNCEKWYAHAERLAEALRDIRDAAYDPWKVAEVTSDTVAVSKLSGRIYSVANAAITAWEGAQ